MKTKVKYSVPFYLCDSNRKIRLDGLVKLLVEASIQNSFDVEGHFDSPWILYRWYIEVFDDIFWKEDVEIHSYSNKIESYLAYRNFDVYKDGKMVARANTKWLLLDENHAKLIKIPSNLIEMYGQYGGFEAPKKEIKPLDNYENKKKILIRKADIDMNNHVNNAAYFQYINEGVNLENKKVKTIEILYKKELKYGDDVFIEYTDNDEEYNFIIKRGDTIATIAKLTFI